MIHTRKMYMMEGQKLDQMDIWGGLSNVSLFLFIYLGFNITLNTLYQVISEGNFTGRGNLYIQLVKVLYSKVLTNSKQLPALPLEIRSGFEL